ncbi:hypothetical protein LDENG_00206480 [Lucifuga dentata]|nr:hypothetical protein LDENG_00206480 [Lucifuga dentata]
MQQKGFFAQKKAAIAVCLVLLIIAQQVRAGPLPSQVQSGSAGSPEDHAVLRRKARMSPLWRLLSKPFGAYCQSNYECSSGICRAGHCSTSRTSSEPVNY